MTILRNIGAVTLGLVAAGATIAAVEAVAHGRMGPETIFGAVAAGYGIGAFAGGFVASKIATSRWPIMAVPVALALLAIANLFAIAHPLWFVPVAALALVAGTLAARAIAGRAGGAA